MYSHGTCITGQFRSYMDTRFESKYLNFDRSNTIRVLSKVLVKY